MFIMFDFMALLIKLVQLILALYVYPMIEKKIYFDRKENLRLGSESFLIGFILCFRNVIVGQFREWQNREDTGKLKPSLLFILEILAVQKILNKEGYQRIKTLARLCDCVKKVGELTCVIMANVLALDKRRMQINILLFFPVFP